MNDYIDLYIKESIQILNTIDKSNIEKMANLLVELRSKSGRLFILGVGGSAGHASHAVCDFRKIAQIEAYSPTDNIPELTARTNDEGWESVFKEWLKISKLNPNDMILIFSVGGGDLEKKISVNLVNAIQYAQEVGAKICGIVGRNGGYTAKVADACVVIPVVNIATVTAQTESFHALIWHLLVSHPKLKAVEMKWESVSQNR